MVPTVERAAVQSETLKPSKPHSPRRTSFTRWRCSLIVVPLTVLYAVMTPQGWAFSTMCSKGAKYSSRRARWEIRLFTVKRSVSASLATKCLTVVPTPPACTPVTYPAPIRPVRYGSSLYASKCRPPSGERWRLTVGARSTWTPLRRAS